MRTIKNIPDILKQLLKSPDSDIMDTLSKDLLVKILNLVILQHIKKSSLLILGSNFKDTCIVGDLHGDITIMKKIIDNFLEEKINSLIFLGDYVDRGSHSLEILLIVYALKLAFPNRVCILKGNHEDINVNKIYGFYQEILEKYNSKIMDKIDESYNFLSLMAVTPAKSFCVHGGLPRNINTLEELRTITKPYFKHGIMQSNKVNKYTSSKNPDTTPHNKKVDIFTLSKPPGSEDKLLYNAYYQLQWNDPLEKITGFMSSGRGKNMYKFGEDVVNQFLEKNQLQRVIRSHENSRGSYQKVFKGLIHIFSSGPYVTKPKKALMIHEKENGTNIIDMDLNPVYTNI
ncbi:MAG: serine/threonine protein phosphatase [archaeon]|nr:serine/threonine protein phosphatase [archaeon]